jgi:CheY-like chemotaxis protein
MIKRKMRILIADDSAADTELLVRAMKKCSESENLLIENVPDGKKALTSLKTGDYDIAFLDVNMPELTGYEVLRYVKDNNIRTKVVFLTGYPDIDENFAKLLRVDEYVEKPIDIKAIEEIINKYRPA